MIATLTDLQAWSKATDTAPAPKPRPHIGPVLMGDILNARGGQSEFLLRWREDREVIDRDPDGDDRPAARLLRPAP